MKLPICGGFVDLNKSPLKSVKDYKLSRYACYLTVQNGGVLIKNPGRSRIGAK